MSAVLPHQIRIRWGVKNTLMKANRFTSIAASAVGNIYDTSDTMLSWVQRNWPGHVCTRSLAAPCAEPERTLVTILSILHKCKRAISPSQLPRPTADRPIVSISFASVSRKSDSIVHPNFATLSRNVHPNYVYSSYNVHPNYAHLHSRTCLSYWVTIPDCITVSRSAA